jgi:XRE family transcriptional regulator, regulator of sulfur utilization
MTATGIKIGRIIREHRKRRGLSQAALAALANVNRTYLGEIERGAAMPSIETIQKLAVALNERLSGLMEELEKVNHE